MIKETTDERTGEIISKEWTACLLEVKPRHNPTGTAKHWVSVDRLEVRARPGGSPPDDLLNYAKLSLTLEVLPHRLKNEVAPNKTEFRGFYTRHLATVSLTGNQDVMLREPDLRGFRVGTYLMHEIVRWVKQWPTAAVEHVFLSGARDAEDDNRERRNRFYEKLGLKIEFKDERKAEGSYMHKSMTAGDLSLRKTWTKNIIVHENLPLDPNERSRVIAALMSSAFRA
jgi:GNAT superfamily N-acetyltransferase